MTRPVWSHRTTRPWEGPGKSPGRALEEPARASGGLLLATLGLAQDEGRRDVVSGGDVVHHAEEDRRDDGAQPAGTGAPLERRIGDRVDGVGGELELDPV